MKLTASIVTHNTPPEQLKSALQSLFSTPVEKIYIVDNSPSPTPDIQPIISSSPEKSPDIEVHRMGNRGFGAGHNLAIGLAIKEKSDFHIVMNPDVRWEGDAVSPLVSYMQQHRDVVLSMPRVEYPDGILQYCCRMLPTPWDLFIKRFLPAGLTRKRMQRYLLANADHNCSFNCPYLLGSFMLFRTTAFVKAGIFDERFFMYPEDIDITRRMHRLGRTMFLPLSTIVHDHAAESRHNPKMLRIHLINMIKYFNKWGWWHDPERRNFNRRLLKTIPKYEPGTQEPGRG